MSLGLPKADSSPAMSQKQQKNAQTSHYIELGGYQYWPVLVPRGIRLYTYEQIPVFLRENPYITDGYRAYLPSRLCIKRWDQRFMVDCYCQHSSIGWVSTLTRVRLYCFLWLWLSFEVDTFFVWDVFILCAASSSCPMRRWISGVICWASYSSFVSVFTTWPPFCPPSAPPGKTMSSTLLHSSASRYRTQGFGL